MGFSKRLAYNLYMAEAEGYLDTHESKMQRLLREIKNMYDDIDGRGQILMTEDYLEQFGLSWKTLNENDLSRIQYTATTGRL